MFYIAKEFIRKLNIFLWFNIFCSYSCWHKRKWVPCRRRRKKNKNSESLSCSSSLDPFHQPRHRHDLVLSAPSSRSLIVAGNSKEMELARILRSCLSPTVPQFRPQSLHDLCIRTAAVYATTSLYEFHDKRFVRRILDENFQQINTSWATLIARL